MWPFTDHGYLKPSGFGTPLFEGHEPNLDIIAVHGIGAHRDYTWSAGGSNWLSKEDMLPSCFPRARIMAYGYASNWIGQLSMATCLVDVADRLLSLLQDLRKDCPDRQLVFIAHCFGGIVVEKALLQALARGTPHRGSSSAGLAQTVATIAAALNQGHKSPLLETLGKDSQLLDDTVRNFAMQANRMKLNIHCFYEERETNIAPLARSLISSLIPASRTTILVERESACLQGHGGTALTLDHFQLNKFTDPHDANYILVRHAVGEMLLAASDISDLKFTKYLEEMYVVDPSDQLQNIQNTWGKRYQGPKRFSTSGSRFSDWQNDEHGRVLWITGSTPVEQSVTVSGIVSEIMNDPSSQLAFCFCENGRDIDSTSVFRILIWMLVKTHRKLGQYLKPFDTPGRRLTIDVLDSRLLSLILSNMITDPDISTIYFIIDQIHTCGDKMSLFLDFISLCASEKTSKVKWIMSGSQQFQTFWLDATWVTKVNLGQSTQPLAATPFKQPTIQGLVSKTPIYYRIRGLGSSLSLSQSRQIISAMFSAEEQHIFDFCSSLVPSCDDNSATQALLMKTDYPPTFLSYLEEDLSADFYVNTRGGRLCFDRHFQGFTQLYANPLDEPINADVIVIPDLNRHAYSSWKPEGSTGGIWIQEFFQQDLPQCRVLAYGYIPKFAVEGIQSMNKYCDELLDWLHCVRKTAEEAHRPLVFVCHGFGCLLAAKLLLKAVNCQESGPTGGSLADGITGMILFAASEKGDILDEIQSMLESEADCPSLDHVIDMVKDILGELSEELIDFETYLEDIKILHFAPSRPPKRVRLDMKPWSQRRELFDLDPPMIIDTAQKKETVPGLKSNIHQLGTKSSPAYKRMLGFVRSHEKEQAEIRSLEWLEAGRVRPKGITIIHDPPSPIADVVLIPGLQGDPWEAWSCTPRSSTRSATLGRFWPQTYLPTTLNNTRVMAWGSEAELPNQLESFLDQAAGLLRDLSALRPMGRSLVFVAHAEGGLLLKKALQLSERGVSEIEKDLIRWTSAIVFLVPRRSLGRDRIHVSFDVQSQQALGSQNQEFARGELPSDVESFLLLQETYGIQASYFLESSATEYRDSVRSHVRPLPSIQSATPTTSATPFKSKPVVERMLANEQGFCRFESCLDNGYVRLSKALRSYTDRIKAMGLHSRTVLLSSLYFTEIDHREGSIENTAINTATWLFGHPNYVDWSKWSFGPGCPGLLWIKGKPGSGKSTLMKKILRHLKSAGLPSSVSVASFFFTARSNVKLQNSALGLFRTLLYLLISQDKALLHAFIPVYRAKCAKSVAQECEWKWEEQELRAFFESAYAGEYPGVKNAVVMVDALDEVRSETFDEAYRVAQDLVHFFRNLAAKGKLKVCLSSRHFPNIQVADCDQIVVEDFNHDDIARFVNDEFFNLENGGKPSNLVRKVAEKANGVFIWVTLVVGRLKGGFHNQMTESSLERVLDDLPSELERLFEGMINSTMSRTEIQNAEEIFQWILLSERPLEKDELRHVLTIKRLAYDAKPPTTSTHHWSESDKCLDSDPEKFLTQLRLYTMGLAEIVLRHGSLEDFYDYSESPLLHPSNLETISMRLENLKESLGHLKSSGVSLPDLSSFESISTRLKALDEPLEHLGDSSTVTLRKSLALEVSKHYSDTLSSTSARHQFPGNHSTDGSISNSSSLKSESLEYEARRKEFEAILKELEPMMKVSEAWVEDCEATREEPEERRSSENKFADRGKRALRIKRPGPTVRNAGQDGEWELGWPAVQFIHESVREFFLFGSGFSLLRADGLKRSLSERHETLAEYCMACIMQSTTSMNAGAGSNHSRMSKTLPFLQYAISGVFYHARQVESGQRVAEKVLHQLADTQQTFWTAWRFAASFYGGKRNQGWKTGCSPLHLLVRHRMFLSIAFMMKLGIDVDVQDSCGESALHYAAREGTADAVKFLIGNQPDVESQNYHSVKNAMGFRLVGGSNGCAANPNLQNQAGETALHLAVQLDDATITQLLLQHGAKANIKNSKGDNALHIALKTPGSSTIQMLVKYMYGADIHAQNNDRESAVHIAARFSNVSILESLVQQGGDINSKDGRRMTPIHHRIAHRYGIRPLVRLGADVRAQSFVGKTVLHMFMEDGSCDHDSFNALGRIQGLLFITDTQGMTALHYAAQKSSAAWVQRLLLILPEQGTILELLSKRNRLGQTAIHFAAQRDNMDAFRVLLEAGADLEIRDRDGMTPVDYAADKIAREPSLERQLYLKGYRRMLRRMNGRMVSVFTK